MMKTYKAQSFCSMGRVSDLCMFHPATDTLTSYTLINKLVFCVVMSTIYVNLLPVLRNGSDITTSIVAWFYIT